MSPTIHNIAFELLGMPHHYEVIATDGLDEQVQAAVARPESAASVLSYVPSTYGTWSWLQSTTHATVDALHATYRWATRLKVRHSKRRGRPVEAP